MDSVENIKKNKIRLTIYSVILIVLGMILGFVAYKLYSADQAKKDEQVSINDKKIADNKLLIVSEELLNNYSNYLEKILYNKDDNIKITEAPAGYTGNEDEFLQYFAVADNLEEDIRKYFSKEVTIDDLYSKYDYESNTIASYDEIKPNYTKYNDKYYLDGICNSTGNKALFSNFKLQERSSDKAKLTYRITIMSIVDNEILETYDDAELLLVYEDGAWKISRATILGRCGLTYSVK